MSHTQDRVSGPIPQDSALPDSDEASTSGAEREVIRRCAVVRTFDRNLFETVLLRVPAEIDATEVPFDWFIGDPSVQPVPRTEEKYRLRRRNRADSFNTWGPGEDQEDLQKLRERLVAYYREHGQELDELYHLAWVNEGEALKRWTTLFDQAEHAFNLARCDDLLSLFSEDRPLPTSLSKTRTALQARLNTLVMWSDAFYRTGRYLERKAQTDAVDGLLKVDREGPPWALQLHAPGGSGKTLFLNWVIARRCVPGNVPCARIDFDHADARELTSQPWRLALELARQWNPQINGAPLNELIGRLSGTGAQAASDSDPPLGWMATTLKDHKPKLARVLLVLDTLEEVLVPHPDTLERLLGLMIEFQANCPPFVLILSGRYNLRERLKATYDTLGQAVADFRIKGFNKREARKYMSQLRGLTATKVDVLDAATKSSLGNPLKLSLWAEVLHDSPLTADQIRADPQVDVIYLIRRVVLRLKDPELRWVLRYGVVPKKHLTLEFLTDVMADRVRREGRREGRDDTSVGLKPDLRREDPFPKLPEAGEVPFGKLWEKLGQYASSSSWCRKEGDGADQVIIFTPDVLDPMRRLLFQQENDVFVPLHTEARDYFRRKADSEAQDIRNGGGDLERLGRWMSQAVYHDFQSRGAEAGADWRGLIESPDLCDRPKVRRALAGEVVGREYIEDDDPPRPRARRADLLMIAPEDLVRAYYHLARAEIDIARAAANPEEARKAWQNAEAALGRLDKARTNVVTLSAEEGFRIELVRGLIQSERGDPETAIATLRATQSATDPETVLEASREEAVVLHRLRRREGLNALRKWIEIAETRVPTRLMCEMVEKLAELSLYFDQTEEALSVCDRARTMAQDLSPRDPAVEERLDQLHYEVLLRAGRPKALKRELMDRGGPESKSFAVKYKYSEAMLDLRQPVEPQKPLSIASLYIDGSLRARVYEIRGRIAAELMDFPRADKDLNEARSIWTSMGKTEEAKLVRARSISLQLHALGDLNAAASLLAGSRSANAANAVPSESDLLLELLGSELQDRLGNSLSARRIVDDLLERVTTDWPPRFRILIAIAGLARQGDRTANRYLEVLVAALGEVTPASARAALLDGLDRCPTPERQGRKSGDLAFFLLPDLTTEGDPAPTPRERGLYALRTAELFRVAGRIKEAKRRLEQALELLLGDEQTLFPLHALLQAKDRLGLFDDAYQRAAASLTAFTAEFESAPVLCAAFALNQAARALELELHESARSLLNSALRWLQGQEPAFVRQLSAIAGTLSDRLDSSIGANETAQPAMETARATYQQLGLSKPTIQRIVDKGDEVVIGGVRIPKRPSANKPVRSDPRVPLSLLFPTPPALELRLSWDYDEGTMIGTVPPVRPGPSRSTPKSSTRLLDDKFDLLEPWVGTPGGATRQGIAPLDLVQTFDQQWQRVVEVLTSLLLPEDVDPLAGAEAEFRERGSFDLCLECSLRDLARFPWEFVTGDAGKKDRPRAIELARYFYRSEGSASPTPAPIRWLQQALRDLVANDLAVDGSDGPALRRAIERFQMRASLPVTGWADGATRGKIDQAHRHLTNKSQPVVLLLAPEQADEIKSARGRASEGIDLNRLYGAQGFALLRVSVADLNRFTLPDRIPGQTLALVHVAARLEEDQSLGVYFNLGRAETGQSDSSQLVSISLLDYFLKALPDTILRPLVILDPPRPPSRSEAIRQLFLRNIFATDLFRFGNTPALIATGMGLHKREQSLIGTLIAMLSQGMPVGEVATLQRQFSGPEEDGPLDELLGASGTALFAHDPETRMPAAGPAQALPA